MTATSKTETVSPPLRRLFKPGRGVTPPHLAGREAELEALLHLLDHLTLDRQAPPGDAVLYGPRGNGKTVLLDAFAARCRAAGAEVIETTPVNLENKGALARWLLSESRQRKHTPVEEQALKNMPGLFTTLVEKYRAWQPERYTLGFPGFISAQWSILSPGEQSQTLENLDSLLLAVCKSTPRVAILDEAHTLDEEVGRLLLNTSQMVNRAGGAFLLALAGTPNLMTRLGKMSSTFWDRCTRIGVGRLSEAAAREALVVPLARYGVAFTEHALAQVVAESQRYPYFIQCWGDALCRILSQQAGGRIDGAIVTKAMPAVEDTQGHYYKDRYEELEDEALLPWARWVADLFSERGVDSVDTDQLKYRLMDETGLDERTVYEKVKKLSALGYLWEPAGVASTEPGIPSLMTYVQTRYNPPAAAPSLKTRTI